MPDQSRSSRETRFPDASERCIGSTRAWHVRPGLASGPLAVSLVLLLAGAPLVHAAAPVMKPLVIVRQGRSGTPFFSPRGVTIDPVRGEVILANTGMHRIEIFELGGRPVGQFVHRVELEDGVLVEAQPTAVAVDRAGHLLVVDNMATYVDVLDFRGRSLGRLEFPAPDNAPDLRNAPGSVAVMADGTIFVGTRGKEGRIYRFGSDYRRLGVWGRAGSGSGQLSGITSMVSSIDGNLVVACQQTELAIQVFDPAGRFLFGFGRHEIGPGNFSFPSGVVVTPDGRIWVTDELRQVVQVFDPQGGFLGAVGSGGPEPGQFLYPSALANGGDTLLAVAERIGNRLQLLSVR